MIGGVPFGVPPGVPVATVAPPALWLVSAHVCPRKRAEAHFVRPVCLLRRQALFIPVIPLTLLNLPSPFF